MDYCSNGPLDKWLEKNRLANAEIEERLVEILRGLQALHQRGITHRDLKPANVLIDNQKRCRVTDFGIAGMANSRITQRQQFNIGTPLYIAPEQMQQNLAFKYMGPVADMFSFGVMAFELFSGEYPFMYRQQLQKPSDITLYQEYKRQGQYFPIHQFCPDLPEHWQQLIEACLHPSPDHRLHSAVDAINHIGFAAVDSEVEGEGRSTAEVQLVVMRGFAQGQRVDLYEYLQDLQTPCLLQLGRTDPGVNNHIDLPDEPDAPTISRQHATLEYASGPQCWYIRDGQFDGGDWKLSTNGTQVNGRHVGSNGASLHVGDIITLGETTLRVELAQLPHWMAST
jgi:serine/threonine protein kinase